MTHVKKDSIENDIDSTVNGNRSCVWPRFMVTRSAKKRPGRSVIWRIKYVSGADYKGLFAVVSSGNAHDGSEDGNESN